MRYAVVGRAALIAAASFSGLHPDALGAQEDAFSLQGLVVTASPTPRSADAIASHVTVLQGEVLHAEGVTTVGDALRFVAGVDVVRNGSFGANTSVFVRGGESDHALVLVDGVQVNQAGGSFDFSALTTDDVERIEIVRGPASALYGSDAMAGVIHVVTRTGRGSPRLRARVETAHYSEPRDDALDGLRWSADVSGGSDRFGYSASVSRERQEGILAFNNRFLNTVASANARLAPDERTQVALTLRMTERESRYPTDGSGRVVDRNQFGFGGETMARVTVARRVTDALELQASLGANQTDGGTDDAPDDPSDPDGYQSLDHFRRAAGEVRASLSIRDAVLTLGGEVEQERQRSFSESTSAFGPFYGRSRSERRNLAAFAHVTGEGGVVSFNAGVRLEDNERFGTSGTWQGGVSAHLPHATGTRARASVGTGIKEPTFYENFAADGFSVGNPDLGPERSLSWEVGVEHQLMDGVQLQATFFDQRLRDLIQYVFPAPTANDPNFYNVAEAITRGVELGADARIGRLDVGAWYTWLDTEVTDAGFDSGSGAYFVEGETLLRRPTHAVSGRASGAVAERGRLHTRLAFVGSRADRRFDPVTFAPEREELSSYLLWTIGAEWKVAAGSAVAPGLTLSARVENLLDESYEEALGFSAPGRQLYLGLSMNVGGGD
jgi:vitamin B12 transporter